MDILTIRAETEAQWTTRIVQAAERGEPQPPGYSFRSHEELLDTLTDNRFAILKALCGGCPLGMRELARGVGRDVRAVHADAQRLVGIGLIDRTENGKLHFPYSGVHLELDWRAAARTSASARNPSTAKARSSATSSWRPTTSGPGSRSAGG